MNIKKLDYVNKLIGQIGCLKCRHLYLTYQYYVKDKEIYLIYAFCGRCRQVSNFFMKDGEFEC